MKFQYLNDTDSYKVFYEEDENLLISAGELRRLDDGWHFVCRTIIDIAGLDMEDWEEIDNFLNNLYG